jgi:hypothetical protein
VRSVGEVKHRLWTEQLAQWVEKLSGEEPVEPEVLTALTVRLLVMAVMVLRLHGVNKRGQCRLCTRPLRMLRFWWRRSPCTVSGFRLRHGPALGRGVVAVVRESGTADQLGPGPKVGGATGASKKLFSG